MSGLRLFIGSHDHWQLWDLKESSLIFAGKPESQEDGSVATFGSFSWSGDDQICAATVDKAFAWSIRHKERLFTVRHNTIISCIAHDSRGILIGDKDGDLTLRDYENPTKVVLSLNSGREKSSQEANVDNFDRKVDAIVRKAGEIVVSVSQQAGVAVWSSIGTGSLLKQWPITGGVVWGLALDGNHARFIVKFEQKSDATASKTIFELWDISLEFALQWVANQDDDSSASEEADCSSYSLFEQKSQSFLKSFPSSLQRQSKLDWLLVQRAQS